MELPLFTPLEIEHQNCSLSYLVTEFLTGFTHTSVPRRDLISPPSGREMPQKISRLLQRMRMQEPQTTAIPLPAQQERKSGVQKPSPPPSQNPKPLPQKKKSKI